MNPWIEGIYDITRSKSFSLIVGMFFIGWGCVLAGLHGKTPDEVVQSDEMEVPMPAEIDVGPALLAVEDGLGNPERFVNVLTSMPSAIGTGTLTWEESSKNAAKLVSKIAFSKLSGDQKQVALALLLSLRKFPVEVGPDLTALAMRSPIPPRYANVCLAWLHMSQDQEEEVLQALKREGLSHPDAEAERLAVLQILAAQERWDELREFVKTTKMDNRLDDQLNVETAVRRGDWGTVFSKIVQTEAQAWGNGPHVILGLIGLAVWFVFFAQQMLTPGWKIHYLLLAFFAIVLGMFSVVPTLMAVYYQDMLMGMKMDGKPWNDFVYFVAGVGFREEGAKLLCVLPLVPFLLKARRLDQLIICACVGLGFGIQENLQYFTNHSAAVAYGRVLTANFLHLALTGIAGIALFDCFRHGTKALGRLPLIFLAVALLHGVYDLFLANPRLARMPMFQIGSTALVAVWFFTMIRDERGPQFDLFAPQAVLMIGLGITFSATLVNASEELGFLLALGSVVRSAIALILILNIVVVLSRDVDLDEHHSTRDRRFA